MDPQPRDFSHLIRQGFDAAPFVREIGMRPVGVGEGWVEAALDVQERHLQQNGFPHGALIATLADHCAGGAASTLCGPGQYVLTLEYKINFLRAHKAARLTCRAEVLKPGRQFTVVESVVHADGEKPVLLAKASVTLAVMTP